MSEKLLLFNKWDMENVEIKDIGLKHIISLKPSIIPVSLGRHEHQKFKKIESMLS